MDNERRDAVTAARVSAAGMMVAELANPTAAKAQTGPLQPKFLQHEPLRSYARASVYGNLVFLAGEDSKDPKSQAVLGKNAEEQAEILFQNMQRTLESLGSSMAHVIRLMTLVPDARDALAVSRVKVKYLPQLPPGKSIFGIQLADPRMLVEIEATAILPG